MDHLRTWDHREASAGALRSGGWGPVESRRVTWAPVGSWRARGCSRRMDLRSRIRDATLGGGRGAALPARGVSTVCSDLPQRALAAHEQHSQAPACAVKSRGACSSGRSDLQRHTSGATHAKGYGAAPPACAVSRVCSDLPERALAAHEQHLAQPAACVHWKNSNARVSSVHELQHPSGRAELATGCGATRPACAVKVMCSARPESAHTAHKQHAAAASPTGEFNKGWGGLPGESKGPVRLQARVRGPCRGHSLRLMGGGGGYVARARQPQALGPRQHADRWEPQNRPLAARLPVGWWAGGGAPSPAREEGLRGASDGCTSIWWPIWAHGTIEKGQPRRATARRA